MKFLLVVACIAIIKSANAINWNGNWAMHCDFSNNDLKSELSRGDQCSSKCQQTQCCTHFVWTDYNGGTCWMKKGQISKHNAVYKNEAVCGVVPSNFNDVCPPGGHDDCANNIGGGCTGGGDGTSVQKGKLIWSDEFDHAGAVSSSNWYQQTDAGHGWGNNEKQYYTAGTNNAYVSNGQLVIESKKENRGHLHYTSARLSSVSAFKYGIFEMKAKLPQGRGIWSAFWLLASKRPMHWPNDGEIDIMEHVGYDPSKVHATIHCDEFNHVKGTQIGKSFNINDPFNQFHTYTLDWRPTSIKAYIDGQNYFHYEKPDNSYQAWPFNNEMNILLNVAVGGNWGGAQGIDDGIFPTKYTVQYVRQYQNGHVQV